MEEIIYYEWSKCHRLEFIVVKDGKEKVIGYKVKSQRMAESESIASFLDFEKAVQCFLQLFYSFIN